MKNVKIYFSTIAFLTASYAMNDCSAQNLFFSLQSGYGIGLNKINSNQSYSSTYNYDDETGKGTEEMNSSSFGHSINFGGSIGYLVNNHLGFEIAATWSQSATFKSEEFYEGRSDEYNYLEQEHYVMSSKASMLQLCPSIQYLFGTNKLQPYVKLGLVVGIGKIDLQDSYSALYKEDGEKETYTYKDDYVYDGGTAIGFHCTGGVHYRVNKNISFFGELKNTSLSYAPTKGEWLKSTEDGKEEPLTEYETYEKKVNFVDSYTENYQDDFDPNKPSTALKTNYAFSALTFNIGFTFTI
ncbi:MAG: hypothetical protein ACI8ZN_002058 [Bacteroidia bacterium]|jgi:hypothetical protein